MHLIQLNDAATTWSQVALSSTVPCEHCNAKLRYSPETLQYLLRLRGEAHIKCPVCNGTNKFSAAHSKAEAKRQPITIDASDYAPRHPNNHPARQPAIIDAEPSAPHFVAPSPIDRTMPMLKKELGELKVHCAKLGGLSSYTFERVGNSGKYRFVVAHSGEEVALNTLFARLAGLPEFTAEKPIQLNFNRDDLLFGDAECPECGVRCTPASTVILCGTCGVLTCSGSIEPSSEGGHVSTCHPGCSTYPQKLALISGPNEVPGYYMRIFQRVQS